MNQPETIETQAIALRPSMGVGQAIGVDEIIAQVNLIQNVMHKVMRENEHYGTIPGCGDKKTLLQPGAQKLTMTFRLCPEYEIQESNLERGHKEYRVICTLKTMNGGSFVGQGVGCCSTMEGKYRWRQGDGNPTGKPVPRSYWDSRDQSLLGGKGFVPRKIDGAWIICEKGERTENDNPADCYNTVLKMAKKRAFVDATITATAASDIFTQDIGDNEEDNDGSEDKAPPVKTPPRASQTPTKPISGPAQTAVSESDQDAADRKMFLSTLDKQLPCAAKAGFERWLANVPQKTGSGGTKTLLLPNEHLEDLPLGWLKHFANKLSELAPVVDMWLSEHPENVSQEAQPELPESDPEWFWGVICPIPRKGDKRDDYLKAPDTIKSLHDSTKDEDHKRLFGFAHKWNPEPHEFRGKVYPPSEADLKFRKALDAFLEWETSKNADKSVGSPDDDVVY